MHFGEISQHLTLLRLRDKINITIAMSNEGAGYVRVENIRPQCIQKRTEIIDIPNENNTWDS